MDRKQVKKLLGSTVYSRAARYYERGRVYDYAETESAPGVTHLTAEVTGTEVYPVRIWLRDGQEFTSADCGCPYNQKGDGPLCKHIGAVMLQYVENHSLKTAVSLEQLLGENGGLQKGTQGLKQEKTDFHSIYEGTPFADDAPAVQTTPQPQRQSSYSSSLDAMFGRKWRGPEAVSDEGALQLIRLYRSEAQRIDREQLRAGDYLPEGTATLEPELLLDALRNDKPAELRLRISAGGRRYVVKDLPEFFAAFDTARQITYGKQLSFVQCVAAYDATSRVLIELLQRQMALLEYSKSVVNYARPKSITSTLTLAPEILDAVVALYKPEGLVGGYALHDGPPQVTLTAERRRGGVLLAANHELHWCKGAARYYYYSYTDVWCMDELAHRRLNPIATVLGGRELFFTTKDATEFCTYVMPEIREFVTLNDPERLLLDQLPLPPVVQFYLDRPWQMRVTVYPVFLYGEEQVTPFAPPPAGLLRDSRAEGKVHALLNHYLYPAALPEEAGLYEADGEEELFRLLDEAIPAMLGQGEVYMSESFRAMQVPRPKVSVGVSVSGSVLDLTVDTGEFPAEELQALLASLREKKKYHRLRDGRVLRLDADLQPLEELGETLEISGASLVDGHAELPLYRAPSLDKAMAAQQSVRFRRDDTFRAISRNFRSVADSAYALPESLQGVLRKYQRTGYRWLRTLDAYAMGGILADDMGLGKTLQVLAYLLAMKEAGETRPSLIVCPASLVLNWAEECRKFTPQLKCLAVDGTAEQRARLAERFEEYDLVVTGYDLLRRDEALYEKHRFYACILDEAQAIKNHTTQKYKAVCKLNSCRRFALTGTPIENRLSELWSIFSFLMPGYLYHYNLFRERFEKPITQDQNRAMTARLNQLTSPFILRRMKSEVLTELPPKIEHVTPVPFAEEQKKLYLAAVADAKQKLRAIKDEDRMQVFAVLTRLRQICCDPRLMAENWQGGSAKLDACLELVASAVDGGHRILLFSQFTSMLELLQQRLDELGISHFTLQGSTPKPVRAQLVRRFNDGEASVFLISLKAGGTGLNLTAADIVIHYDPWWNVAAQNQATDRAYRIGQQNMVQVYKLIAQDTIEEKILQLQQAKQSLADSITGSAEGSIMTMSREEILGLLD